MNTKTLKKELYDNLPIIGITKKENVLYGPDNKVISDLNYVGDYDINKNPNLPNNPLKDTMKMLGIKENAKSRRNFIKNLGLYLGSALLALNFYSCAEKPAPQPVQVKILTTFNATYTLEGNQATGRVRYVGNGKDVTVKLGEQADLGTAPEGESRNFDVYVLGEHA
ncbi:MAG: hypothetical protein QXD48_03740, partial [Candidatus Aenigmatarchaeota archaeon]